jgi:iron complex transport system ATP-binding protein
MSQLIASGLTVNRGGRPILRAIDCTFEAGHVTAVLGPNGAGKSTLLSTLAGLLPVNAGTVRLDDQNIFTLPALLRAQRLGYLPQNPEIAWAVDVQTVVGLGRIPHRHVSTKAQDTEAIEAAMRITATAEWASRDVTTLSGGERARVLLARVLAGEPEWILADEPFAGLDPAHQFETAEMFQTLAAKGRGLVVTLHDLTLAARVADRVIVICDGRIVADGSPREALSPDTLMSAYGIEARWIDDAGMGASPMIAITGRRQR